MIMLANGQYHECNSNVLLKHCWIPDNPNEIRATYTRENNVTFKFWITLGVASKLKDGQAKNIRLTISLWFSIFLLTVALGIGLIGENSFKANLC